MLSARFPAMDNLVKRLDRNAPPSDTRQAGLAFQGRALVSVILTLSFLLMVVSGAGLWVAPPGRIANWTNWTIFGLRKGDWADLHLWFGVVFVAASGFHIALNWRPLVSYFKRRLTRRFGFRREWLAALLFCGVVFGGTRLKLPPFSSLLVFTESLRESWDIQSRRPPIPHAELLTVSELADEANFSLSEALARLVAGGIQGAVPEIRVADLAERNRVPAQRLYQIMTAQPGAPGKAVRQRGGRGGAAGGGYGWRTLAAFCQEEGIDLQVAQRRLEVKGIKAAANQTLREIAEHSGYERPFDILEIIRGN